MQHDDDRRRRVPLALVVAATLASPPAWPGQGGFLYYGDGHVVVDTGSAAALTAGRDGHPLPFSSAAAITPVSIGNVSVAISQPVGCGYRSGAIAVLCLDHNYELTPTDRAELLGFTPRPFHLKASSNPAALVAYDALRAAQVDPSEMTVEITRDPSCVGQCDRRITLEAAP